MNFNLSFGGLARHGALIVLGALGVMITLLLVGNHQAMTGDEPRYVMYARSILLHGGFIMPWPEWQEFYLRATGLNSPGLPTGKDGSDFFNSVYLPTLLSPVALAFGLSGLRDTALIAGLIGLFYLFQLCKAFSTTTSALLATAVAGLTIPLLPYLHLFYMEAFLFSLICVGWHRLQDHDRPMLGDFITAIILLTIPFVHIRASAIAGSLYLMLLYQLYSHRMINRTINLIGLAMAAAIAFVTLNVVIYGAAAGPVGGSQLPPPSQWFPFLAMQLFNVRHGLFAYAPVWLIGFAGLWAGAVRGPGVARQGLVLTSIAAITSVGQDAGESWPARYWVQLIPMLAVGFCAWWDMARRPLFRLVAVLLIGFTLVNTILFFQAPNDFLENRQSTKTYQTLFDRFGHLNFGLVLPVAVDDEPDLAAERNLAIFAGLFIASMAVGAARRQSAYAVIPLLLIAAAIDLARVKILKPTEYNAVVDRRGLTVTMEAPVNAAYLQFGRHWTTWFAPPDWPMFELDSIGSDGRQFKDSLAANQIVGVSCQGNIRTITIDSPTGFDIASEANYRLFVYRSASLLRTGLSFLRKPC